MLIATIMLVIIGIISIWPTIKDVWQKSNNVTDGSGSMGSDPSPIEAQTNSTQSTNKSVDIYYSGGVSGGKAASGASGGTASGARGVKPN